MKTETRITKHQERADIIQNLPAQKVTLAEHLDKKAAEGCVRSFPEMRNFFDGRIVTVPISSVGKMLRHKGFDISRIISEFPMLYRTSLLGWSEPEILKDGHKEHRNIWLYHNYINKFTDGTEDYYVRFTVREENVPKNKKGRNEIHSAAISNINIYKKGGLSQPNRVIDPAVTSPPPFIDRKLQEFFASTNNIMHS